MIFDIVTLAVLLISAVIAFLRGFIREVLTILGVVGGLAAAWFGGPVAAPLARRLLGVEDGDEPQKLMGVIPYDMAADILAYGTVFIVVVIVLSVASHFLASWARTIGLGAVDRTLGVVFGLVRGIVVLGLLYLPVQIVFDQKMLDEKLGGSKTRFYIESTVDWMMAALPESVREDMKQKTEETAREKLQDLDILDKNSEKDDNKSSDRTLQRAGPFQGEKDNGYDTGERREMNRLFENNAGQPE